MSISFLNNVRHYGVTDAGKILGESIPVVSTQIIQSQKDICELQKALSFKYQLYDLIDRKLFDEADDVAEAAAKSFKSFKKTFPGFIISHGDLPPFLFRYSTTGTYVKIMRMHVDILERAKRYDAAIALLKRLLKMNICEHRRGHWWIRLIINHG